MVMPCHSRGSCRPTAAEILLIADKRRGKALAVGDRVLARLQRVGPDSYEGQVIRKLDRHRQRLFGSFSRAMTAITSNLLSAAPKRH